MKTVMLPRLAMPGLFVTGTDTGVGKTIIAAAIADHFRRRGLRVGVFKPITAGCVIGPAGELISEDAQWLRAAGGERFELSQICPVMFAEPLAPALAARREGRVVDWSLIREALEFIAAASDVIIFEGAGGVHVPLDDRTTVLDIMRSLALPAVCVGRTGLGTINHTLLTVDAMRGARVELAGVVLNRFPMRDASVADQTSAAEIERFGVPVRCVVPDAYFEGYTIPAAIAAAIDGVDWARLARL